VSTIQAACDEAAEKALSEAGCKKIGYRQFGPEKKFEYFGAVGMGWVFRLIGGILAPATLFPVRLLVSVQDNGAAGAKFPHASPMEPVSFLFDAFS